MTLNLLTPFLILFRKLLIKMDIASVNLWLFSNSRYYTNTTNSNSSIILSQIAGLNKRTHFFGIFQAFKELTMSSRKMVPLWWLVNQKYTIWMSSNVIAVGAMNLIKNKNLLKNLTLNRHQLLTWREQLASQKLIHFFILIINQLCTNMKP